MWSLLLLLWLQKLLIAITIPVATIIKVAAAAAIFVLALHPILIIAAIVAALQVCLVKVVVRGPAGTKLRRIHAHLDVRGPREQAPDPREGLCQPRGY